MLKACYINVRLLLKHEAVFSGCILFIVLEIIYFQPLPEPVSTLWFGLLTLKSDQYSSCCSCIPWCSLRCRQSPTLFFMYLLNLPLCVLLLLILHCSNVNQVYQKPSQRINTAGVWKLESHCTYSPYDVSRRSRVFCVAYSILIVLSVDWLASAIYQVYILGEEGAPILYLI